MVETQTVEQRVAPLAARIAAREGCELAHCEYVNDGGRWVLRLYIDREGGVTIADCTSVSRQMSAVLDVEDFVPHAYSLEVSSPGLDRSLNTPDDYHRFSGESVRIRTVSPAFTTFRKYSPAGTVSRKAAFSGFNTLCLIMSGLPLLHQVIKSGVGKCPCRLR